jgi:hypothetical protein
MRYFCRVCSSFCPQLNCRTDKPISSSFFHLRLYRTLILLLTMAAVGLSIAGSLQCQFLLVDLTTGTGWDIILDLLPDEFTSVWVGVFRWGPAINGNLVGECQKYDSFFGDSSQYYLEVAQTCAIAAPGKFSS